MKVPLPHGRTPQVDRTPPHKRRHDRLLDPSIGNLTTVRPTTLLFLVFTIVPLAEIALFIWVGDLIGLLPTVAIVLVTALLGAMMVSRQGRRQLASSRSTLLSGGFPTAEIANGAMILVAGALLITPGFLTDLIGFLLLTPPVRDGLRSAWKRRRENRIQVL